MSDQDPLFEEEEKPGGEIIYIGRNPTETEAISGKAVYEDRKPSKPIKPGSLAHRALAAHSRGRWTAYEVSVMLCGDPHGKRRETRRLFDRRPQLLFKDGTKTNVHICISGRPHVDAYIVSPEGWAELHRLNAVRSPE